MPTTQHSVCSTHLFCKVPDSRSLSLRFTWLCYCWCHVVFLQRKRHMLGCTLGMLDWPSSHSRSHKNLLTQKSMSSFLLHSKFRTGDISTTVSEPKVAVFSRSLCSSVLVTLFVGRWTAQSRPRRHRCQALCRNPLFLDGFHLLRHHQVGSWATSALQPLETSFSQTVWKVHFAVRHPLRKFRINGPNVDTADITWSSLSLLQSAPTCCLIVKVLLITCCLRWYNATIWSCSICSSSTGTSLARYLCFLFSCLTLQSNRVSLGRRGVCGAPVFARLPHLPE